MKKWMCFAERKMKSRHKNQVHHDAGNKIFRRVFVISSVYVRETLNFVRWTCSYCNVVLFIFSSTYYRTDYMHERGKWESEHTTKIEEKLELFKSCVQCMNVQEQNNAKKALGFNFTTEWKLFLATVSQYNSVQSPSSIVNCKEEGKKNVRKQFYQYVEQSIAYSALKFHILTPIVHCKEERNVILLGSCCCVLCFRSNLNKYWRKASHCEYIVHWSFQIRLHIWEIVWQRVEIDRNCEKKNETWTVSQVEKWKFILKNRMCDLNILWHMIELAESEISVEKYQQPTRTIDEFTVFAWKFIFNHFSVFINIFIQILHSQYFQWSDSGALAMWKFMEIRVQRSIFPCELLLCKDHWTNDQYIN